MAKMSKNVKAVIDEYRDPESTKESILNALTPCSPSEVREVERRVERIQWGRRLFWAVVIGAILFFIWHFSS